MTAHVKKAELHPKHLHAEGMLLGMAVVWGSTFSATRWMVGDIEPWQLLGVRFTVATLLSIIVWPKTLRFREGDGKRWMASIWLGVLLWLGYWLQAEGMKTTTAQRSGFITALSVPMVPVFQIFILKRWPQMGAVVGVALALAGTTLMCNPAGGDIVIGDVWTLGCALAWGIYIVELSRLSERIGLAHLLVGQCAISMLLSLGISPMMGEMNWDLTAKHWAMLLYLGAVCTFLTSLAMCRYQPRTTPTRAALIYATEPVFASIIAFFALSEKMSALEIAGACLIMCGLLCSEVVDVKALLRRIKS